MNTYRISGILLIPAGAAGWWVSRFYLGSVLLEAASLSVIIIGLTAFILAGGVSDSLRTVNKVIFSLIIALSILNILLTLFGQADISAYFAVDSLAFLSVTLAYVDISAKQRTALNIAGTVMFAAFLVILTIKLLQIPV